jgi:integrase
MLNLFDNRRLDDLIDIWYNLHGNTLKDHKYRYQRLLRLSRKLGNPIAKKLTKIDFINYRNDRLKEVKPATINHEHRYLLAVFNELKRLELWSKPNPLNGLKLIKYNEHERGYLTLEQIKILLNALLGCRKKNAYLIAKICLATGSRWNEAETLKHEHIRNNKIFFYNTKNSKFRSVPISKALQKELTSGNNFGRLFTYSRGAYKNAVKRSNLQLPQGQLTHILRHTFASHFMMNGGNILTLQKILGHSSLTMTLKYSHLAPNYLKEAVSLNPLQKIGKIGNF